MIGNYAIFQSTLPVGGATTFWRSPIGSTRYFNPRSPWGERRASIFDALVSNKISIHAPRGGSDSLLPPTPAAPMQFQSTLPVGGATKYSALNGKAPDFNPRSPWGERPYRFTYPAPSFRFQSTLPVGGATFAAVSYWLLIPDFNPRSPWGERQRPSGWRSITKDFNPRSPWGERQPFCYHTFLLISNFNPRSPWGERHSSVFFRNPTSQISIHAPRGGSDSFPPSFFRSPPYFNPRSPWGERPGTGHNIGRKEINFNPRSPWGERRCNTATIHKGSGFQSTLPVGGATFPPEELPLFRLPISIHAPRGGSDGPPGFSGGEVSISIHAPRGGSDSSGLFPMVVIFDFNPRSPWGERPSLALSLVWGF